MKMKTFFKLWIFLVLVCQISCTKEKESTVKQEPPITLSNMLECYRLATWDSAKIQTQLVGKWEWEYIRCYWNPEDGNYDDYKGVLIEFKADKTLEVLVNGKTTQTTTWHVVNLNDGFYGISTNELVVYVPGRILFCTERVLFNDSYTDGCDNYFKRKN